MGSPMVQFPEPVIVSESVAESVPDGFPGPGLLKGEPLVLVEACPDVPEPAFRVVAVASPVVQFPDPVAVTPASLPVTIHLHYCHISIITTNAKETYIRSYPRLVNTRKLRRRPIPSPTVTRLQHTRAVVTPIVHQRRIERIVRTGDGSVVSCV